MSDDYDTSGLTTHSVAVSGSAVGMEREAISLEREAVRVAAEIKALQAKHRSLLNSSADLRSELPAAIAAERAVKAAGGIPDSDILHHYHNHGCAPAIFPKNNGSDHCSKDYKTPLIRVAGGWVPNIKEAYV